METSIRNDFLAEFETRKFSIGDFVDPVDIDQVYKNKAILKSVIEKYAIEKRLQYKIVRSNAISLSCGRFQYEEIPCEHDWAVLKHKNLVADGNCSDLYKPKTV
uniref:SWIM-type domain-containing protein n=1 Tax=Solanum lycopersicum TaxID=4081 RepID=A0A3Q7G4Z8_SOLLC